MELQLANINNSLQGIVNSLQYHSFWETQLFGVLIGALIGLIPWVYLLFKDRPRIKVSISHVLIPSPSTLLDGIGINISNSGRRPVVVDKLHFKFKDGESLVFMNEKNFVNSFSGLPKTLNEGNSHFVAIFAGEFAEAFRKKQCYPKYVCYVDALGKVYRCKTSNKFWNSMFNVQGEKKSKI